MTQTVARNVRSTGRFIASDFKVDTGARYSFVTRLLVSPKVHSAQCTVSAGDKDIFLLASRASLAEGRSTSASYVPWDSYRS